MKYELAKELKDAGFPQKTESYLVEHRKWEEQDGKMVEIGPVWIKEQWGSLTSATWVSIPTLSELIEACVGVRSRELVLNTLKGYSEARIIDKEELGAGKTPEEAVAKLWLALNKV